jgi:hypothetical protein
MLKEANMNIEELARKMREHALRIEAEEEKVDLSERKRRQDQLDAIKKLYFNAGRWAGGARDRVARDCFQKVSLSG